jgi:hypothetical protein
MNLLTGNEQCLGQVAAPGARSDRGAEVYN